MVVMHRATPLFKLHLGPRNIARSSDSRETPIRRLFNEVANARHPIAPISETMRSAGLLYCVTTLITERSPDMKTGMP